jgi:hypothetical protein
VGIVDGILFFIVNEEVGRAQIAAVVAEPLYLAEGRADLVEGIEEAELAKKTEPHRQEH